MKNPERFDEKTWRKVFAFLRPDESSMTNQDVEEELRNLGMDTSAGLAKLERGMKLLAETRAAREALEAARKQRPSLLAVLESVRASLGTLTKDRLHQIIAEQFSGTTQAAFFRKLESAASEDDLVSLLDDMSKLDAMTEHSDDAET